MGWIHIASRSFAGWALIRVCTEPLKVIDRHLMHEHAALLELCARGLEAPLGQRHKHADHIVCRLIAVQVESRIDAA